MKRAIVLALMVLWLLCLASCSVAKNGQEIADPYFTGRVIEKYENTCLIEVTDTGNGNFFAGEKLIVTTDVANCPEFEAGDVLTVVFDGKVALSYPGQVLNVYTIHKSSH